MANFFIVHGIEGYPEENWFPWLKKELEKLGHKVFLPQFPTPKNQTLNNWLKVAEKYKKYLTPDSIVIGHSLGVSFLLNIIEKHPVKAAFFIAGFIGKPGNKFDESVKTFAQKTFDWAKIKNNCKNFCVFRSDNDPYLKPEEGKKLAEKLGAKLIIVKNAGHFNSASGYETFPLLLNKIKTYIE